MQSVYTLAMNAYFLFAGVLAFVVGLVHSVLGERWVFKRMRAAGVVPTQGGTALREPHVRILWASWHVVTLIGWCLAALLVWLALQPAASGRYQFVSVAIAVAMLASSLLVFLATKGKHPGWAGLLGVAVLTLIAEFA
jgi:hypothetical protein